MASRQVNGDVPSQSHSSAVLQHLLDYPVVNDSIHTIQNNELGQRAIKLTDSAYKTFAAPILPYFAKPYGYVSPYVQKADAIGDQTLGKIDERFPAVRRPTQDIVKDTRALIFLPYNKAFEGRDHVYGIYSEEYKKTQNQGVVAHSMAALSTVFVVSNETLSWLSGYFSNKKQKASEVINEKVNQ